MTSKHFVQLDLSINIFQKRIDAKGFFVHSSFEWIYSKKKYLKSFFSSIHVWQSIFD